MSRKNSRLEESRGPKDTTNSKDKEESRMFRAKSLVRNKIPSLPYEEIALDILGPKYELSFVVAGDKMMRSLNVRYKNKNSPANVLSFQLDDNTGEIFLNINDAKNNDSALLLFIHACAHLKGMRHGSIMDAYEQKMNDKWLAQS